MAEKISETRASELLTKLDKELRDRLIILGFPPDDEDPIFWEEPVTILDLIQAEIDEGRPVVRKVRVADGDVDRLTGSPRASSGSSAELTGSQPYTSIEALALTTEALALVYVSPVQMASKLISTLSKYSKQEVSDISVKFAAKKEQLSSPVLELDAQTVDEAMFAAGPIATVLGEISKSLDETALDLTLKVEH